MLCGTTTGRPPELKVCIVSCWLRLQQYTYHPSIIRFIAPHRLNTDHSTSHAHELLYYSSYELFSFGDNTAQLTD